MSQTGSRASVRLNNTTRIIGCRRASLEPLPAACRGTSKSSVSRRFSPLTTILGKVASKGYSGALSVELFLPRFRQGDPFEVASEIRQNAPGGRLSQRRRSEAVMRQAGVL